MLTHGNKFPRALLSTLFLVFAMIALGHSASLSAAPEKSVQQFSKVNINQASATQLAEGLHGVGVSKADAIVEYRNMQGKFKSVDDLAKVKGIGKVTIDKNRSRISL